MYDDGRFAKHCRFRYFALNTEMRWRALQSGRIYLHQNPDDDHLTIEELRDMVGREGVDYSTRVVHYASTLRGTRQYWTKQRSRLIAMVDSLGMPTIFFTHSAADLQWPELAHLLSPEANEFVNQSTVVVENPALADWYFCHRIQKFVDTFYKDILGVTDYWYRFEWQHRGSPHIHGLAWITGAPNVEHILASSGTHNITDREQLIRYIDSIVSTCNPAVLPDGTNLDDAPTPRTNPHVCGKRYTEIQDYKQDLNDLVATCQRHTRCSTNYCLRNIQGQQLCRFGYPKQLQPETVINNDDSQPELLTARNDPLLNSYNPIQLSGWRANVDMQYIVSRQKVIEYCAKYATKSEPRSQSMREIFEKIVHNVRPTNSVLTVIQKLLISTIGERDYSSQETCHILLQLPMFKASRDFVVLSLDGSRMIQQNLREGELATVHSILDHYIRRPSILPFNNLTLDEFARNYSMPSQPGTQPVLRRKNVIVIIRPYYPPDKDGPDYESYCRQKLMLHVTFRRISDLLGAHQTYAEAFSSFLQSTNVPSCLQDDVHRLERQQDLLNADSDTNEVIHLS